MDRFIDTNHHNLNIFDTDLKSNMDRFIECMCAVSCSPLYNLKSNMDRFIDSSGNTAQREMKV